MSLLVLHMDKFKKDAIRGIQSHNRRERESHSNPDIDYGKSQGNCDLCENPVQNYAQAIQNRIDDLLMVKAIRKDAVHMCGLVVSSDKAFFDKLTPEEKRRFFEEARDFLTDFVGRENVISAMVHMDEKTPHMHFLHVPVTKDGRLCAKDIYTKTALKKLQDELPKFLQERGFEIERGVEQKQGSAKKHLDTREFKQQQEMLVKMKNQIEVLHRSLSELEQKLADKKSEETELDEQLQKQKIQIQQAEEKLVEKSTLREANLFNYKEVLKEAKELIETFQAALADKEAAKEERDRRIYQANNLLRDRDEAVIRANKLAKLLEVEKAKSEEIVKRLNHANQAADNEIKILKGFITLKGHVEQYNEFLQELARDSLGHEKHVQAEVPAHETRQRIRMR